MKKIIYSGVLKSIAIILFTISIVFGALAVCDGIVKYYEEENDIYSFERDFSESRIISGILNEPEDVVYNAYYSYINKYNDHGKTITEEDYNKIENNIRQGLEDLYYSDEINYFVQWNDFIISNCDAKSAEELMSEACYSYIKRDKNGNVEHVSTNHYAYDPDLISDLRIFDQTSTIVISCSIKEDVFLEYKTAWECQEIIVIGTFAKTIVCLIVALLMIIYLLCVCGKDASGEMKTVWIDHIWFEIHLASIVTFSLGSVIVCAFAIGEHISGHFPNHLIYLTVGAVSILGSLMVITSLLSVTRNIKARKLVETSIILRILRWSLCLLVKVARAFWKNLVGILSKRTGVILLCMLLAYTIFIGLMGICTVISPVWLIVGILGFGFACFVVAYRAKDFDEIKKGINEVRNGNLTYKIPELKCEDMKTLAANANDIAKGLDESVAAKVKAERLKSELITNVSHDLKTPITSIISYTELLSKLDGLSDEARDYIAVIAKKSEKLKILTQDLFDISKAQSGNDTAVLEKLNVALLINQALGEHDNEIQHSGLPFCVEAPKELYILADGRKMSRVLSNLINNILKYTMKNTRVFILASEKDGMIEMVFKNISAYPLNFSVEEITQRFVRGDESRTAEGNGLGLAIAKSYTEICNGSFDVVVDGDMFKAILKFKKFG